MILRKKVGFFLFINVAQYFFGFDWLLNFPLPLEGVDVHLSSIYIEHGHESPGLVDVTGLALVKIVDFEQELSI